MTEKNHQNNSAIIAIVTIVAIVLGISLLVPKLSTTPTGAAIKDQCGNNIADFGETCATCPTDIPCREGYSCISEQCEKVSLKPKGTQYCGYLTGYYGRDEETNIALKATDFYQTCVSSTEPSSTADKLTNGAQLETNNIWMCTNSQGLTMPQFASIKLDQEYIINHARVMSSYLGFDDANPKEVTISISVDSTDGRDGHWLNVAQGQLRNTYEDYQDIFFDPVSAKWVRLTVNSLWNEPFTTMGVAELVVYQASYICDSDYEMQWNK